MMIIKKMYSEINYRSQKLEYVLVPRKPGQFEIPIIKCHSLILNLNLGRVLKRNHLT